MMTMNKRHCYDWATSSAKGRVKNKVCHETRQAAERALEVAQKKFPNSCPTRVYYCLQCKSWHLTSKTGKEY